MILWSLKSLFWILSQREFHVWQTIFSSNQYTVIQYNKSNRNNGFYSHPIPLTNCSTYISDLMIVSCTIAWSSQINRLEYSKLSSIMHFLSWTLNQTRLFQFRSSIFHKFLFFILNIDTTKDWNMLDKPIWTEMIEKS